MKIAFLITRSDTIGGAHVHVKDLAVKLGNDGHDVAVLIGGNGVFSDILKKSGVMVRNLKYLKRHINPFYDALALLEIRKELKIINPDLLTIHSSKSGILGRIASINLKFPVIFTVHGWSFTEGISFFKRKVFFILEKILVPLTSRIVCVSDYDRNLALDMKLTAGSGKIITIHNGITELKNLENLADFESDIPFFLMIARFDEQKDHESLFYAAKKIENLKIDLIGSGSSFERMKSLSKELKLDEQVRFLGEFLVDEKVFTKYQGYILISNWEGLPISIIEAMRAGLPVVASNVGGCCEEVFDGVNGFLIEKNNINIIAEKLSMLSKDKNMRKKFGKRSRQIFKEKFEFGKMYDQYLDLYNLLVNENADK
ncbi:MAG: glycosyltransferase family 4 protein [Desulfobacteraceae bacterium]|nr:glycosyltransferase family 4 protein [Desulfobacteraceae bacterium]MCB9494754.1 glycosyltransferase family 4 protein [Desulfobacteraceae bacterium]